MLEKEEIDKIHVAFDATHKNRAKINDNYSHLRDFLNENRFVCYNFSEPLMYDNLQPFDILVLACPDFSKLSRQEISYIERWILEDGGGLLLLSHAGGDKGRNSNLSELSERFGIAFENDQVLDETSNLGFDNLPIIHDFRPPHPITEGITSFCYRAGCSLTIIGNAFSIAYSNETSEPFSSPLICVSEPENGKVCAIGSYEMFRNEIGGGFNHKQHSTLALNIFKWLLSDFRLELKSKGLIPTPEVIVQEFISEASSTIQNPETAQFATQPETAEKILEPSTAIDIKISNKSDLMNLLKTFSNQINKMQKTIKKLIKVASASEKEIAELKESNIYIPPGEIKDQEIFPDEIELGSEQNDAPLSQENIIQSIVSDLSEKSPISEEEILRDINKSREKKKIEKVELSKEASKSAEGVSLEMMSETELRKEKENLKNRINSIQYLLKFIKKKFESGKLDEKSYNDQSEDLKEDLKKLNKNIKEIEKRLEMK
ncbi:MAG: hypothetical protein ACTSWE_12600 [Promethearchaeota archaeon]